MKRSSCVLVIGWALALQACDTMPLLVNVNTDAFEGPELAVVSYNLLHGGPLPWGEADETLEARFDLLAREIVRLRPDVVILQEASDTRFRHGNVVMRLQETVNAEIAESGLSYNALWSVSNRDPTGITGFAEGNGLLSRFEILEFAVWEFREQPTTVIREHRKALRATLRGRFQNIDVIGTHLRRRAAAENARELTLKLLPSRGNDNPLILAGDFNSLPTSEAIQTLLDAGLVDVWTRANPEQQGFTSTHHPLRTRTDEASQRIDYVFVSPDTGVVRAELFLGTAVDSDPGPGEAWLWGSDHAGLSALVLPGTGTLVD